MDYRKAAEARKSIREFTDKPVSGELKEALKKSFDRMQASCTRYQNRDTNT